jgi:hypothetical protein
MKDGEIHFRAGAYQPDTPRGQWLIAHEVAHAVQVQSGRGTREGTPKELEREADRAATLAMLGQPAPIGLRAPAAAAYAFNEGEDHEVDVAERHDAEPARGEDTGPAADAAPEAAEHVRHDAASTDEAADHTDAHDEPVNLAAETSDVTAIVPADEAAAAAPGVGGGAAAKPQKPVPDVAAAKPEAGLGQLQGVRPDKLGPALGQVHTATGADAAKARAAHEANPYRTGAQSRRCYYGHTGLQ